MSFDTRLDSTVVRAAGELRAMILDGRIEANASLKQDDLARRLSISRTPLRLAMQRLEREGLISTRHHHSARVVTMTRRDVEDVFDMRAALEPLALAAAFTRLDKGQMAVAEQCLDVACVTASRSDLAAANWTFHEVLYTPCERPMLLSTIAELNVRATRAVIIGLSVQSRPESSHKEHVAILAACRDRDLGKATRLLAEHLQKARAAVLQAIVE